MIRLGTLFAAALTLAACQRAPAEPTVSGKPLAAWEAQLDSPDTLAALQAALAVDDAKVRSRAAADLGKLGAKAAPAAVKLSDLAVDDLDRATREAAKAALAKIGPAAVAPLEQQLQSKNWFVRSQAAEALGGIGHAAAPAADALIPLLSDAQWSVRYDAVIALESIGDSDAKVVAALRHTSSIDADRDVRMKAYEAAERASATPP